MRSGRDVINSRDLPQHLDRLQRARTAGRVHRRGDDQPAGAQHGSAPASCRRGTCAALSTCCATNDLIWNYVVSSWLMGEEPPAFDLLSWNADSTRMPAEMHSFYLRSCYLENQLARGVMELAGQRLDRRSGRPGPLLPGRRAGPHRPLAERVRGRPDCRPARSGSCCRTPGHIAGIVNPPRPKSLHRVVESGELPAEPRRVARTRPTTHRATWWEDWASWISARAGGLGKPPRMGSAGTGRSRMPRATYVRGGRERPSAPLIRIEDHACRSPCPRPSSPAGPRASARRSPCGWPVKG